LLILIDRKTYIMYNNAEKKCVKTLFYDILAHSGKEGLSI